MENVAAIQKKKSKAVTPASEFRFDPEDKSCICPKGEIMQLKKEGLDQRGIYKVFFIVAPQYVEAAQ